DGQAEQVGLGQRRPQLVVDPVIGGLHLPDPVGSDEAGEDPVGGLTDRLLLLAEGEVHHDAPWESSARRGSVRSEPSTGWNTGRVRSSSKVSNRAWTGVPMPPPSGAMPATLAT